MILNRFQNRLFEYPLTDAVGGAAAPGFVFGAVIIGVTLTARGHGLSHHAAPTVCTENQAGEWVDRFFVRRDAGILHKHTAHRIEHLLCNNRLMGVLHPNPLILRFENPLFDFIVGSAFLSLHKMPCIDGVFENPADRHSSPFCLGVYLKAGRKIHSQKPLVFQGGRLADVIEPVGDPLLTESLQLPRKNIPYNLSGIGVNDQLMFRFLRLQIAIYGKSAEEFALLALDIKLAPDFHGNISAIRIVDEVLERNDDFV